MSKEPDPMDFVNSETFDEMFEKVSVNGIEYPLVEFNQAERHLWLKIRDESDLSSVIREFNDLRRDLEDFTGGVIVEKKEARIEKLNEEIDKLIETTPFDKWTPELEARLEAMVAALDAAKKDLAAIQEPLESKALEKSAELQARIEELRERQGLIQLRFVWHLAKQRHGETRSFDEYAEAAKGSDRENAGEVVKHGNFTWETAGMPRSMNRAMRRGMKKTT